MVYYNLEVDFKNTTQMRQQWNWRGCHTVPDATVCPCAQAK